MATLRNTLHPFLGKGTKVISGFSKKGTNPQNSSKDTFSANRIQKGGGISTNPINERNNTAARQAIPRGRNKLNKAPFEGYLGLSNRKSMGKPFPAIVRGQGNPIERSDSIRLREALGLDLPDTAMTHQIGTGQKKGKVFIKHHLETPAQKPVKKTMPVKSSPKKTKPQEKTSFPTLQSLNSPFAF